MTGHAHVAQLLGHSQHTCPIRGPCCGTPHLQQLASLRTAQPRALSRISTCLEISVRKFSGAANRLELPRKGGLETVVALTFSPFGPVLPGSPGGPYTMKIRWEQSVHQAKAGQW